MFVPRRAVENDLATIAAMYHVVWHEAHSKFMPAEVIFERDTSFFIERMAGLLPTTLVETRNDVLVGFSAWEGNFLTHLYVTPTSRRSGVATELMRASEQEMAAAGTTVGELDCVVGNHRARSFYERMGWRHCGNVSEKMAGSSSDTKVAFWRMRKEFP